MYYTEKLLPEELRKGYSRVIDYMNLDLKMRTYDELKSIMDEVEKVFSSFKLKDFFWGLIANMYKTDPIAVIDIVASFNIMFNDVLKKILDMLYLEHAAGGVVRYSVGRDKADERYLSNVRDHQKQIFESLYKERKILTRLSKSFEFKDALNNLQKLFKESPYS